jgi:hypothetical protein
MCPRGDLNPDRRAFSPIPRLNTQVGEKSPVWGFHELMLAGTPDPVSSGLAGCGPRVAGAGTIPGVTAARLHSQRALPVGYGSRRAVQWCLAALTSALGWPKAQTDDTGGSGRTGVGTRYPPIWRLRQVLRSSAFGTHTWSIWRRHETSVGVRCLVRVTE